MLDLRETAVICRKLNKKILVEEYNDGILLYDMSKYLKGSVGVMTGVKLIFNPGVSIKVEDIEGNHLDFLTTGRKMFMEVITKSKNKGEPIAACYAYHNNNKLKCRLIT